MQINLNKSFPKNFTFANPNFLANGIPQSLIFDDVYFSDAGGAQEKEQVFVHGNKVIERIMTSNNEYFTIGETGFGTGLSLLMLIKNLKKAGYFTEPFLTTRPKIVFITTELYPMRQQDLLYALQLFPEIQNEAQELATNYIDNNLHGGLNILNPWPQIQIYLLIGDLEQTLPALKIHNGGVDAWFLDGFSPQKDKAMWSIHCAQELKRLSNPKATITSYTVAGFVRRNLAEAGFNVKKVPGFGRKREMLWGENV